MTASTTQTSFSKNSGVHIGTAADLGVSNADLATFYATYWARPICLGREDFLNWQMSGAPESRDQNASVVVLKDGQLIAAMGVTPATFYIKSSALNGAELTTWIVLPDARGMGLGQKMLSVLQDSFDVLAGAAISEAALPLYLGAGFSFQAHVPRFFWVSDPQKINAFVDAGDAQISRTLKRQQAARRRDQNVHACAARDLADLARQGLLGLAHFRRDQSGLDWRYDQHPIFSYEAFRVSNADNSGEGVGVVLREDLINGTPILHLVDLFGGETGLDAALSFVEDEARRRKAAFVDMSVTAGVLTSRLRARGWSSAVDDPLVELPSLFHPVELRRPPTTSLVIWSRHHNETLFDFGRLHVTKGDLDLDRPTLHYIQGEET